MDFKQLKRNAHQILQFAVLILLPLSEKAWGAEYKPILVDATYQHNKWGVMPAGKLRVFRAYISSLDDADDDNGDGEPDKLGVPEWVAYEMKYFDGECISSGRRPSPWISDPELVEAGFMPTDASYAYSRDFRKHHPNWFVRGHLAMKLHAERLGNDAAWNTHTMFNAVPQRDLFNRGIWLDLENITGAWAQKYGRIWIVTGPIFLDGVPASHIGEPEKGEMLVAVPDALFKIVIIEEEGKVDSLAFIYPQLGAGYLGPYDHTKYLTSIDEIEALTHLDFLTNLKKEDQEIIESRSARNIWEYERKFISACRNR